MRIKLAYREKTAIRMVRLSGRAGTLMLIDVDFLTMPVGDQQPSHVDEYSPSYLLVYLGIGTSCSSAVHSTSMQVCQHPSSPQIDRFRHGRDAHTRYQDLRRNSARPSHLITMGAAGLCTRGSCVPQIAVRELTPYDARIRSDRCANARTVRSLALLYDVRQVGNTHHRRP